MRAGSVNPDLLPFKLSGSCADRSAWIRRCPVAAAYRQNWEPEHYHPSQLPIVVWDIFIGIGAVVTKPISKPGTYIGIPARRIEKRLAGGGR